MGNSITKGDPARDPRSVDAWLHIDDFTPGIWNNQWISTQGQIVPAPLGSAVELGTWCCGALAGGGLGPLPAMDQSASYPVWEPGVTTAYCTGFLVNPGLDNGDDEIIHIFESDNGTTHYLDVWSHIPQTNTVTNILSSPSGTTPGYFGSPYPTFTRMTLGGTGNPHPEVVFPAAVATDSQGTAGHLYIYPPILSPTSPSVQDLIVGPSSTTGQVIAYGNRVIVLTGINYGWPVGSGINTNENINYTDPPQSTTYGDQQSVLGTEIPWGYGAWGTQSVGELILIKKYGGAVMLNGDIDAPSSVITLPAVQSTGDFVGQACSDRIGLIYCSEDQGAWLWNGGNTSQKISMPVRDNFYVNADTVPNCNNYGFNAQRWQDWIIFSNNWLYNPDTNSWWVLYPSTGNGDTTTPAQPLFWFDQSRYGNFMYASPMGLVDNGTLQADWLLRFNSKQGASHYKWTMTPYAVGSPQRTADILQVLVRVSDPANTGTAHFTVSVPGTTWTESITSGITSTPTTFRFNMGADTLGLDNIQIAINGDNTTSGAAAPVIWSVDIGYKDRALQPSQN